VRRAALETRIGEIAALDQPLRRDLYALLVDRGDWVGRDDAADALDVPRSVAAFHLDKLADAGLVDVRYERAPGRSGPGAGRPAKQYRRSEREVSVSLPERHYDLAGALLADAVVEAETSGRPVGEALREAAHRAGVEIGLSAREGLRRTRPSASAVAALERLGYEPRRAGRDIALANCPFHALAERHRSLVCGMNLDLLRGVAEGLGAEDRLVPTLQPEEGMCCVRLRAR
jgi:predicted ArsR family transcriptional regulator